MSEQRVPNERYPDGPDRRPPPAFNIPGVVFVLIAAMGLIHAYRTMVLGEVTDARLVLDFAFIPGCYGGGGDLCLIRPLAADVWSPLTYAFLHGSWTHYGINTVWLIAFGTPVARRLGAGRFLAFAAAGSVAGAAVFYLVNSGLVVPVIGASGTVSALMGGACRFAFVKTGASRGLTANPRQPMISIGEALSDRTVLVFVIAFFATNFLVGSGVGDALTGGGEVAWEAHLGGFVFGFFCLPLFDRMRA
ncbi:rhomboid family intramembrane serine protease [Jiella pelagia]|uniref:Rhomboid family intramembrane serine protease n=1 Tax=Jiella pelagia TaxID=2986949 RepID=A0ABY7BZP6_9HYPH|nr:rhomboid family intramembrane serine protease [Jiella pelagia]WAP68110.1 rhomboid family intramembrane serine protease [Jiella pelagia]